MPEAVARLIPIGGSLDRICVFSKVGAEGRKPWTRAVQGELPAADDVIQEKDGVFVISDNVRTAGVVCDPDFKALVDSIM
jgi:hypothetical protein